MSNRLIDSTVANSTLANSTVTAMIWSQLNSEPAPKKLVPNMNILSRQHVPAHILSRQHVPAHIHYCLIRDIIENDVRVITVHKRVINERSKALRWAARALISKFRCLHTGRPNYGKTFRICVLQRALSGILAPTRRAVFTRSV